MRINQHAIYMVNPALMGRDNKEATIPPNNSIDSQQTSNVIYKETKTMLRLFVFIDKI